MRNYTANNLILLGIFRIAKNQKHLASLIKKHKLEKNLTRSDTAKILDFAQKLPKT